MLECLNAANGTINVACVWHTKSGDRTILGWSDLFILAIFSLVCKPQTISSQICNHVVKNGNQTAEQNLSHRKHEQMCVEFENGIKNGVEATFEEISDGEWILKNNDF